MGLFSGLFGKSAKIEHPFFGTMSIMNSKNKGGNYFSGRRHFAPKDDSIEIGLSGTTEGPTQQQVDFFNSIEKNYAAITASITPLMEDQFQNFIDDFKIHHFKEEFEPVYLDLPACDTTPVVWEIAFESDHDRNHTFTLTMQDFTATDILIDG